MNGNGFSLVELIVVIAIMGILLSVATPDFHGWQVKHNIEKQVKEMKSDFENFRLTAIHQRKRHQARITPTGYAFVAYSSEGDLTGSTVLSRNLAYGIQTDGGNIDIDSRGLADISEQHIWVAADAGAAVDSLIVSAAKTNMGKRQNDGTFCKK